MLAVVVANNALDHLAAQRAELRAPGMAAVLAAIPQGNKETLRTNSRTHYFVGCVTGLPAMTWRNIGSNRIGR